jgi:hypothetical protein
LQIEDVKMAAVDVKKEKNTSKMHQNWNHKDNSVVFYTLNPFEILDVEKGRKYIQIHQNWITNVLVFYLINPTLWM